ncbi:MAG: bi-domain-containing oxidoreductase [Planctomycetota bacterium]|jgi:predicted dehydrogenase
MKQVLQNLRTGELEVADIPAPTARPGCLLIQTRLSLISAGTERMLTSFAKSSLLGKARQQPDKVKQAIDKIKTDGLLPTFHSVFARLDEPMPLGYCNCGTVIEISKGVEGFDIGDRVISNGPHAELVSVPKNLCAKIPENVTDEQAVFTVLASIGLQGIRLIEPAFGETVVVFGLGLIGLICVQILKSCGCRVIGIDIDKNRLSLASEYGAEVIDATTSTDTSGQAIAKSNGNGVDAVLITASAKGDSIVHQSAQMSRKRGRIVLIGVVNLNIDRADFYDKELSFQVSCSYGPGRYDQSYEDAGRDYPFGFVRWTEHRNFEAVLEALSSGVLKVDELISQRIPIEQAGKAYQMLTDQPDKMALVLTYPTESAQKDSTIKMPVVVTKSPAVEQVVVGVIGAGTFAKIILLPAVKHIGIRLKTVADINGVSGLHVGRKFGFEQATNDYKQIFNDPEINTVFITTRHDLHAPMVIEALQAGKNVHVEKPLCLNREQLADIKQAYEKAGNKHLLVGFNRRFSPHAEKICSLVASRSTPICMSWLINAGHIPADIWVQDTDIGGGRIIGEGCHWMDFMRYLVGDRIVSVSAAMIGPAQGVEIRDDKITVTVTFADGSIGTLHYFANGHKSYPKETFELFCDKKILQLDNFIKLKGFGWSNFKKKNLFSQDKGHKNQFRYFVERVKNGGEPLIPFEEIENVTLASFAAVQSANGAGVVSL